MCTVCTGPTAPTWATSSASARCGSSRPWATTPAVAWSPAAAHSPSNTTWCLTHPMRRRSVRGWAAGCRPALRQNRHMAQPDFSPSAERNKQPILEVLQTFLPAQGTALEIASGTGQHVVWLAEHMPLWNWQPTEVHPGALYNIEGRATEADLANVNVALPLDVCKTPWQLEDTPFDLILCIK